jgi:biotin--protein ligase
MLMPFVGDSDQKVTLTTTTPHQPLVIKTITLDHGLLRCVPDRRGEPRSMYDAGSDDRSSYGLLGRGMQGLGLGGKASQEYVDLQPDGNSFDLMSGLIKRKV